jgi:hypothetical protein
MAAPAPTIPPPPVPPANQPSVLSRLLNAVSSVYTNPADAPLLGLASGFGAAGAPHAMTPISMGQAVNMANQSAQAYRQQVVGANIQQEAALPYQVMRTQALEKSFRDAMNPALPAHQRAAAAYRVDSMMGWNAASDPTVANRLAQIKAGYQPVPQAPGTTLTTAAKVAQGAGQTAHGAVPEGSTYDPATNTVQQAAGAPAVLAANAANKAGGAAAATLPYALAQHYVTRAPGTAGGTLGPQPGPFAPVQPGAPNPAAMQHMIGLQQGLTNAAQAAGRPAPMAPAPGVGPSGGWPQRTPEGIAPPGSLAAERAAGERNLPAVVAQMKAAQAAGVPAPGAQRPILTLPPAPAGAVPPQGAPGIFSPGSTVAGYQLQKQAADQTLAQESASATETEAAQAQLARLTEMQQALGKMPFGGNIAKVYDTIGDALNYVGMKIPGLTAMQEYTKYRTNFVADAARKMGAKVSYQEVGYIAKGVPDFSLAGNAPRALLAQLQGASQYDIARNQAMAYYAKSVPNVYGKTYQGTTRGFEQWWQKTGVTPGMFMYLNTALALPDAQRAQYIQHFQRNATGKMFLKQYRKGQEFINQNRDLVPFWSAQQ